MKLLLYTNITIHAVLHYFEEDMIIIFFSPKRTSKSRDTRHKPHCYNLSSRQLLFTNSPHCNGYEGMTY